MKSAPWLCVVVSHRLAKATLSIVTGAPPGTTAGAYSLHLAGERWAFPWLPHSGPGFMAVASEGLSFPANTAKVPACGGSASSSECLPARSFEFYFYILFSVCACHSTHVEVRG